MLRAAWVGRLAHWLTVCVCCVFVCRAVHMRTVASHSRWARHVRARWVADRAAGSGVPWQAHKNRF
jgi:hypothetical protein